MIDELVVRGLPAQAARAAADALEARLTAIADDETAQVAPRAEAFRRLEPLPVDGAEPNAVGDAVAAAVWKTVARGARR